MRNPRVRKDLGEERDSGPRSRADDPLVPGEDGRVKLLVAALSSELAAFPSAIAGFDRLVTGAGKIRAAVALTQALERARYDEIVVVGTSGSVDPELAPGVHEIGAVVQHDVSDMDGVVGRHATLPHRLELGRAGVVVATGDHFVDDADQVRVIRDLGGVLVDMETFAYVWVAEQYGTPIRVLRAVSDSAQDGALVDWKAAVASCSAELWDVVRADYAL